LAIYFGAYGRTSCEGRVGGKAGKSDVHQSQNQWDPATHIHQLTCASQRLDVLINAI